MAHDGFISYSHAADGQLAPAIQRGLQRLAKPWNHRRALRIFRDETGLSTNPHLWSAIETALDDSEWFVLLASAESARSEWVNKEISHWLATKSSDRILPVVTDGTWAWDEHLGGFTPDSTAVPAALRDAIRDEPRHLDLRWARTETDLDLRNARFRDAVADLAAPMHGVAKDELESEDVRQHRRARRLARGGVSALALLVVLSLVFGTISLVERDRASHDAAVASEQARLAVARGLAAEAVATSSIDLSRSLLLSVEGERLADNPQTRGALLSVVQRAQQVHEIVHGSWSAAALAPDGKRVYVVSDGAVSSLDLATRRVTRLATPRLPDAHCIGISPDGRVLAVGGDRGVYLLDAHTGQSIHPMLPGEGALIPSDAGSTEADVSSVEFSPNGKALIELSEVGYGEIWAVADWRQLGEWATSTSSFIAPQAAFSPDSRWVADTGQPGAVYETSSGRARYPALPQGSVADFDDAVAYSPDGQRTAIAGEHRISFRDPTNGERTGPTIPTGNSPVSALAYSPDGAVLAGARFDGSIQLWNARSGNPLQDPLVGATRGPIVLAFDRDSGHLTEVTTHEIVTFAVADRLGVSFPLPAAGKSQLVNAIAVSPNGRLVAGTDASGNLDIWATATRALRFRLSDATPAGNGAESAAFTNDDTVAVAAGDGSVSLWNAVSGHRTIGPIHLADGPPAVPGQSGYGDGDVGYGANSVAFDARHRVLVALTGAGAVISIDAVSGRVLRRTALEAKWDPPQPIGVRPDGAQLAVSGPNGVDLAAVTGRLEKRFALGPVGSLAYSPNGGVVAVGLEDGRVVLIDSRREAILGGPLTANRGGVEGLAFDPTGDILAAGGQDGTVTLWDVSTRDVVGPPLASQSDDVDALAFTPDGREVVAGSQDQSVVSYDIDRDHLTRLACGTAARNLTRQEWRQYLGSLPYHRTCPQWPAGT